MAKYKLQEMPDLSGLGKKKLYPKVVNNRTMTMEEVFEKYKSVPHSYSTGMAMMVLADVANYMKEVMDMGYGVKVEGLGTFSLALEFADDRSVDMKDEGDAMKYRRVRVKDVNYKVDPMFLKRLKSEVALERESSGVSLLKEKLYSLDERIERACEWIDECGFITLREYAVCNNISRTAASVELKKLSEGDEAPFVEKGRGSHKVWVRRVAK